MQEKTIIQIIQLCNYEMHLKVRAYCNCVALVLFQTIKTIIITIFFLTLPIPCRKMKKVTLVSPALQLNVVNTRNIHVHFFFA